MPLQLWSMGGVYLYRQRQRGKETKADYNFSRSTNCALFQRYLPCRASKELLFGISVLPVWGCWGVARCAVLIRSVDAAVCPPQEYSFLRQYCSNISLFCDANDGVGASTKRRQFLRLCCTGNGL